MFSSWIRAVFFSILGLLSFSCFSKADELGPLPILLTPERVQSLTLLTPASGQELSLASSEFTPVVLPEIPLPQVIFPPPRRPLDPEVKSTIDGSVMHLFRRRVQVTLLDGRKLQGKVGEGSFATHSTNFDLLTEKPKGAISIRYEDVVAANLLPRTAGENTVEIVSIVALTIVAIPLYFAWGVSCRFQCP